MLHIFSWADEGQMFLSLAPYFALSFHLLLLWFGWFLGQVSRTTSPAGYLVARGMGIRDAFAAG